MADCDGPAFLVVLDMPLRDNLILTRIVEKQHNNLTLASHSANIRKAKIQLKLVLVSR
jgi:hypothetical protein